MAAKRYIIRNSDQPMRHKVEEFEQLENGKLTRIGFLTLTDFDRIDVYVSHKGDKTLLRAYTTADTLPTDFKACSIVNNSLSFTILSEDTATASLGDLFISIKLWTIGGRSDGEDLKEQTTESYLATLIDAFGSTTNI